jgi:hypothetical protein
MAHTVKYYSIFLVACLLMQGIAFSKTAAMFGLSMMEPNALRFNCDFRAPDSLSVADFIAIDSVPIRPVRPSLGIQFYQGGILMLSDTRLQEKVPADHVAFGTLDTYYLRDYENMDGPVTLFSPHCPFPDPPEATSFTSDQHTLFFTRPANIKKGRGPLKIYESEYEEHALPEDCKWTDDPAMLPFCQDRYAYFHPASSPDGSSLIFASNRSPSMGGIDLFIVHRIENGWTDPVNLGVEINTAGNEVYPTLDEADNLFFSSDGHPGEGGHDLYVCPFNGSSWDPPANLGPGINSGENELALKFSHQDPAIAIYTREQLRDSRNMQLFMIRLNGQSFAEVQEFPQPATDLSRIIAFWATPSRDLQAVFPARDTAVAGATPTTDLRVLERPAEAVDEKADVESIERDMGEKDKTTGDPNGISGGKTDNDRVIFRIQIMTGGTEKTSPTVTINNQEYETFAYYYKGAYRYCIGSFYSLEEALRLRSESRKSGYPDAFVAAFRNGERVTDPSVFRRR